TANYAGRCGDFGGGSADAKLFGGRPRDGATARSPIGSRPINDAGANTLELEFAQGPPSHIAPIRRQPSKAIGMGPSRTQTARTASARACLPLIRASQYPPASQSVSSKPDSARSLNDSARFSKRRSVAKTPPSRLHGEAPGT